MLKKIVEIKYSELSFRPSLLYRLLISQDYSLNTILILRPIFNLTTLSTHFHIVQK